MEVAQVCKFTCALIKERHLFTYKTRRADAKQNFMCSSEKFARLRTYVSNLKYTSSSKYRSTKNCLWIFPSKCKTFISVCAQPIRKSLGSIDNTYHTRIAPPIRTRLDIVARYLNESCMNSFLLIPHSKQCKLHYGNNLHYQPTQLPNNSKLK